MYKLLDRQDTGAMQGMVYKTREEVLEHLKSYHYDIENVEKMDLDDLLEIGDWELVEIKCACAYHDSEGKCTETPN